MTKKLYIPTSSLNFSNILSSESISPKSFYLQRNFGNKHFELINENNFENCIILYEEFSNFDIPKSEVESHPLTIEIKVDDNFIEKLHKIKDGVYACDFTIYLNPRNTKFYFFTENDKKIALSLSDSSLETKPNLYLKRISTIERPQKEYEIISNIDVSLNTGEIKKDFRINRLKGFLYGYYIGALLSTNEEYIERLSTYRDIYDIFVSILSTNADRKPTKNQDKQLDILFRKLSLYDKLYSTISNIHSRWLADTLLTLIYPIIKNYISYEGINKAELLKYLTETDNAEQNRAINLISKEIDEINNKIKNSSVNLSVSNKEVVVSKENLKEINTQLIQEDIDKQVFIVWINEIFLSENYEGRINIEKKKFADDLTYCAKKVYGDSCWEKSLIRKTLNDLRKHLAGEEFNFNWDNGLLSSIAAFVTKGEDWEKLLRFMQSKSMYDYRLSFAFYGAFKGFAKIERDFTDILYTKDKGYISEVYKEFHRQLFDEEIVFIKDNEILNKDKEIEIPKNNNTFEEEVWNTAKSSKKSSLTPKEIEGIKYSLSNCNENGRKFIELLDNQIQKGSKVFKSLQKEFYPNYNNNDKKTKKINNLNTETTNDNLFTFNNRKIYEDSKAYHLIKQFESKVNLDKFSLQKDFQWFQDEYKKGELSKYYKNASRNNKDIIDAYCRHLKNEQQKHSIITDEIIEEIRNIFNAHYE